MRSPRSWFTRVREAFDQAPFAAAAGAVGVFALAVGVVVRVGLPDIGATGTVLVAAGGAALALGILDLARHARTAASRRRRRYGLNVAVMVAAFVALVAVVNVIAYAMGVTFDLTASQEFTLADQTGAVLGSMNNGVQATAFFINRYDSANPDLAALRTRVEDLLREFKQTSHGKFSYRFVDPETDPTTAQKMGVSQYGAVVFQEPASGRQYTVLPSANVEQSFLTALLVVTGKGQKTIYISTGHRELSVDDTDPNSTTGFGLAVKGLEDDGYKVSQLDLNAETSVPSDAAEVIIPSPVSALSDASAAALTAYLRGGGRVLVMIEPESDPSWAAWLQHWGISVGSGYVIDPSSHLANSPGVPIINRTQYAAPYITSGLDATVFPGLAPLGFVDVPSSIRNMVGYDVLALTTPDAFAAAEPTQATAAPNDPKGPFMAAAVLRSVAPMDVATPSADQASLATIAIFGDGQFTSNKFFPFLSDGDLFLNTANDLAGDVPLVSLRAKPLEYRGMVMSQQQFTTVRLMGWLVLPVLMTVAAAVAWVRRR